MKKLTGLNERMILCSDDANGPPMPTRREVLIAMANVKADTADDARRTRRLIGRIRSKEESDLIIENDDLIFLVKVFEKNGMSLTAWMQGQILDFLDSAEQVPNLKEA